MILKDNNLLKNLPRWVILLIDLLIVATAYFASNFVIHSFIGNFSFYEVFTKLPFIISVYFVYFNLFKTYKGVIRKTGLKDAQNLFMANSLAFLTLAAFSFIVRNFLDTSNVFLNFYKSSYSILFIHTFVSTVSMVVLRLVYKAIYYDYFFADDRNKNRIIIYGAGDSGIITLNALVNDTENKFTIVSFVDDDPRLVGKRINGINVFHSSVLTEEYIKKLHIDQVIISIQNIKNSRLIEISSVLADLSVVVKITPPVSNWLNGNYSSQQIKAVNIEDLLGRDSIQLDNPIVEEELKGSVILVTGAAGSIGSEIARQIAMKDYDRLVLVDQAESALYDVQQSLKTKNFDKIEFVIANIRDQERMHYLFNRFKPNLIYHAAAYKHVPLMENYPYEAVHTNVKGTKIIADLAHEFGVNKFVMVSTDKAVNPTNVMGATKRVAEMYVNHLNSNSTTNYIVTRFGNVLGSNGSVIPLFKRQLDAGGPLTVTHQDITRFFMTIPEACQLVLEAGTMGKGGEIFVFDMGKSIKIFDLAKRMIKLSGYKYPEQIDIKIVGLRPGEKIYEELLADDENTIKTHHEKIMIANVNRKKCEDVVSQINNICSYTVLTEKSRNNIELVRRIKLIVPEYKSQNSTFEALDKS